MSRVQVRRFLITRDGEGLDAMMAINSQDALSQYTADHGLTATPEGRHSVRANGALFRAILAPVPKIYQPISVRPELDASIARRGHKPTSNPSAKREGNPPGDIAA